MESLHQSTRPSLAASSPSQDPQHSHLAQQQPSEQQCGTLVYLCRRTIVAHLQKYAPHMFSVLDEDEWEAIVRLRHAKTQPIHGSGGLDGTGRVAPAIPDKFVRQVEDCNPHLAESPIVDQLVWKDCTEFSFQRKGINRPLGLLLPWPILMQEITYAANMIATDLEFALDKLRALPVNLTLLQNTGVGKIVRKSLKEWGKKEKLDECTERQLLAKQGLETILKNWMSLVGDDSDHVSSQDPQQQELVEDLKVAETCSTWRQLFACLKSRKETLMDSRGKRMREIRRNLASDRPKVVKVRPATAQHERILERAQSRKALGSSGHNLTSNSAESKLLQVRREAIQSKQVFQTAKPKAGSFGDAVAFASHTQKKKSATIAGEKRKMMFQNLGGGKRMQIPANVVGPSRTGSGFSSAGRTGSQVVGGAVRKGGNGQSHPAASIATSRKSTTMTKPSPIRTLAKKAPPNSTTRR